MSQIRAVRCLGLRRHRTAGNRSRLPASYLPLLESPKSFKGRQLTIGRTAGVASLVASSPGAIEAVLSLVEPPLKRFRFRGGRLSALP